VKVRSARFIKSVQNPADFPRDQLDEVAFVGRSNVGKSKLLNALAGIKGLARISSSPGRTQTINFFSINERFYFVDLPGYGYAKVPKRVKAQWRPMVEGYLEGRPQLKLVLLLVDCRIEPTPADIQMMEWVDHYGINKVIILTKTDKLSRNQLVQSVKKASKALGTEELIPFSTVSGLGKDSVWSKIRSVVSQVE
jgi:GTP-binding protein